MLDSELLMSKVIKKDRDFIILNSDEILKKKIIFILKNSLMNV